ncbi:MAG: sensor histidine kinase, partial [Phycicoccus sp.]
MTFGALGYRAMVTPVSVLPVVFAVEPSWGIPALLSALALAGGNAWAMTQLGSWLVMSRRRLWTMLGVDTVVVVAANLLFGVVLRHGDADSPVFALWPLVQGSVLLFAALAGMRIAFGVVLAGVPLAAAMCQVYAVEPSAVLPMLLGHVLWLLVAWTAVYLARYVLRSQEQVSAQRGVHEGRQAERARGRRLMHDTALQSLEAIALLASNPAIDDRAGRRLVERAARGEIRTVRKILADADADTGGLQAEVTGVVAEARARGLQVELIACADDGKPVETVALDALCGALREALSNVNRHAAARRAVVRVDVTDWFLSAEIEDDGVGFDPDTVSLGFGIPESIEARTRAAGGSARVRSRVGQGTTVFIKVPRAEMPSMSGASASDNSLGEPSPHPAAG